VTPTTTFHGENETPLILLWSYLDNLASEGPKPGPVRGGCTFSNDHSDLEKASAVIFEYTSMNRERLPWTHYRNPNQVFVLRIQESPPTLRHMFRKDLHEFNNNFINWTMTYRRDAEVTCSYMAWGLMHLKSPEEEERIIDEIISRKSRGALWLVSNCGSSSDARAGLRMATIKTLIDHGLPLDAFGSCFSNKHKYDKMTPAEKDSYKFYMAFENSRGCREYITEKFWRNALLRGLVPIVWGPRHEDLDELVPRGSYIYADDFATPQLLVDHVSYLVSNDTAYRKYFDWRVEGRSTWNPLFEHYSGGRYCESLLCDELKKGAGVRNSTSIENMEEFWFGKESEECMNQ